MPGLDFDALRATVSMAQVLDLLGFTPTQRNGRQWRGPCPVHGSTRANSTSFSVNVVENRYRCFKCGSFGNQLELWAAVRNENLFAAAKNLCDQLGIDPPWIRRW